MLYSQQYFKFSTVFNFLFQKKRIFFDVFILGIQLYHLCAGITP